MGIPSYFSHIIRNYSNIIRSLKYFHETSYQFQHLFMDCNSIIYDAVHSIEQTDNFSQYEDEIILNVIDKIKDYIYVIKPTDTVFIAFDGVAPLAKMEQQRTRRHKTLFLSNLSFNESVEIKKDKWNTSAITPGTEFMEKLSKKINYEFTLKEKEFGVKKIIVSTSQEPGEGEHKLFDYLRKNDLTNDNIALYGLDSDLIMLSIFHMNYCNNIYNFREAPEFIRNSLPVSVKSNDANEPYFLDIEHLCKNILAEMRCVDNDMYRVYDYVFLCFFLGNDFLPHFPSMNIRTHGISTLLDIYTKKIGNIPNNFLINKENHHIIWKNVRKIIKEVADSEEKYLLQEYELRRKYDKFKFQQTTEKEKETMFQNVPIIYRNQESYICPEANFWESRYYKSLFKSQPTNKFMKDLCSNYLEGLEWVFKYYSKGCYDWQWKYNYHYPPLFKDLVQHIPHFETEFVKKKPEQPLLPITQLSYVLPITNHHLMPKKVQEFLSKFYSHNYVKDYQFEWAFCRYFWESHPVLPEISNSDIKRWEIYYHGNFC